MLAVNTTATLKHIPSMKPSALLAFLLPILVAITHTALGQNSPTDQMPNQNGHLVKSNSNGKTYQLEVSLPLSYNPADARRYPVLYLLDGHFSAPSVSIRSLLDFGREIDSPIIVSIGDPVHSLPTWFTNRWADYTPSADVKGDSIISKQLMAPPGTLKSGGATAFLATIRQDIIPFIDKIYKTTQDRGISGHSLGGLFTAYCLLTEPDLFKRYGILSPSLFWNNEEMLAGVKSFVNQRKDLDANIFMSIGGLEPLPLRAVMNSFADALTKRNYPGVTVTTTVFDEETHISVIPASTIRALRTLYPVGSPIKDTMTLSPVLARTIRGQFMAEDGIPFNFTLEGQKLYWESTSFGRKRLIQTGKARLEAPSTQVKFDLTSTAKDTILHQLYPGGERVMTKYIPDSTFLQRKAGAYIGRYSSSELASTVELFYTDKHLQIQSPKVGNGQLTILGQNHMTLTNGDGSRSYFKFVIEGGKVMGFEYTNGRIRRMQFAKVK